MKTFIKNNWIYILWASIYILISWALLGDFWVVLCAYAVSIGLALSPIGEMILRLLEHARPLQTREEKEYLEPLFQEVYESAKKQYPKLSNEIELYICDVGFVNAFAIGRTTIAVTSPAIQTFSKEELRGIIGHEFGHIANGDTKALLLNVVGNGIFTILTLIMRIGLFIINFCIGLTRNSIAVLMGMVVTFLLNIMIFVFLIIGDIILAINSRSNEFHADKFSYNCGFGDGLISSLYIFQKLTIPSNIPLIERLRASHPHLASRIAKLEAMQAEE